MQHLEVSGAVRHISVVRQLRVKCYREFQRSAVRGSVREWKNVLMLFLTLVGKAGLHVEIYRPSFCPYVLCT